MTRIANITKTFRFEAAHQLVGSNTHCDHVHGHSYRFEVHLSGPIVEEGPTAGMVMNFATLSDIVKRLLINKLDHRFLSAREQEPFIQAGRSLVTEHSGNIERDLAHFMDGVAVLDVPTTTAEEMARVIGEVLYHRGELPLQMIRFWETETGCAEYFVPQVKRHTYTDPPLSQADAETDRGRRDREAQMPDGSPAYPAFKEEC